MLIRIWGGEGEEEEEDGKFISVYSIAVGIDGSVYAYDIATGYVQHFTSNGSWIRKWRVPQSLNRYMHLGMGIYDGTPLYIIREMSKVPELSSFPPGVLPVCGRYLGDECIYLFCAESDVDIQMFKTDGTFIRKWNASVRSFAGCAINDDGLVYIGVLDDSKINVFDSYGTLVRQFSSYSGAAVDFCDTSALWVDKGGTVYMADPAGQRIQCYQHDGAFIRSITHHFMCSGISWITDTECGRIFLNNLDAACIEMFRTDGAYIGQWGRGLLKAPVGPKVIRGDLYVVDGGNHRVVSIRVQDMDPATNLDNLSTKRRRIL